MFIILLFVSFRYMQIIDIDINNIDTDIDTDYRHVYIKMDNILNIL